MEWLTAIRGAVSYAEDHLTDDVSLDDVARAVHLSPFFLQRGFSLMTGFGVGEYLRNRRLYEAALDLGATPFKALMQIVIPQIVPGIVSGFMLAVTLSLDDYFIAMYTKPATFDTISTYVVNATKGAQTTIKTALWALSTVIFLIVVLVVLLSNFSVILENVRKKKSKKKKKGHLEKGGSRAG